MFDKFQAIGDIHGDKLRMIQLLQESKIVNKNDDWIAENTLFVFTGDYVDRGEDGIGVIKKIIQWKSQASELNSEIITICGNHDASFLAMLLDLKSPKKSLGYSELSTFKWNGGKESELLEAIDEPEILDFLLNLKMCFLYKNVLFQHADGFNFYEKMIEEGENPIDEINLNGKINLQSAYSAWNLIFYHMTEARGYDGILEEYFQEQIEIFGGNTLIHGHTQHKLNHAKIQMNGKAINIDASLSYAYSLLKDRGIIYDFSKNLE